MTSQGGIAVCAIVKDEGPYIAEWLAYHHVAGVSKFFLYDNGSRVPLEESVKPFQDLAQISVTPFPGAARQIAAYTDCMAKAHGKATWVALIDVDEFLVPVRTWTLSHALRPYEGYGGVAVNWQTFGPAGHATRPSGLQIEAFARRTPSGWDWNRHVKTIARPERARSAANPHFVNYHPGWHAVNEHGAIVPESFNTPPSHDVLQVNHYFTRSRAEYEEKMLRGAGDGTSKSLQFFEIVDRAATTEDRSILRYAPAVKSILKDLKVLR